MSDNDDSSFIFWSKDWFKDINPTYFFFKDSSNSKPDLEFKKNNMVVDPKIFSEMLDKVFPKTKSNDSSDTENKESSDKENPYVIKMEINIDLSPLQSRLVSLIDAVDDLLSFIEMRRKSR